MSAVDFKKIIQEMVVPELQEIKTKVSMIEVEIRRLDEKIDNVGKRLDQRIDSVGQRIDALERQVISIRDEFKLAIDIHERLAAVEAKIH